MSHLSDDTNSRLSLAMFHECVSHCSFHGDSKLSLIHSLSVLELAVLIASKNVSDLMDGEPMNFEMIFDGESLAYLVFSVNLFLILTYSFFMSVLHYIFAL